MLRTPKQVPHFDTEEEELRFWDEHNPWEYIAGPADIIIDLKRRPRKRIVTMRLDESLYDELRAVAARHGLPYQKLMRGLLRQALTALAVEEKRPVKV